MSNALSISHDVHDFYARVHDALSRGGAIEAIPEWLCDHTKLKGKKWTFKDHEMQIDIARETANKVVCMKCSQVGLSELQVRVKLALLAIKQGFTGIYVLPTRNFAQKFAKGRIDPVVEESLKLSNLIISAADGSEMKRFGLSTLYIGGANTDSQAISIPADVLTIDEYDFCNPVVLGKLQSRLRHADSGGYRRYFSTPTLPGYGISAEFDPSSRGRYACRCEKCEKWIIPDFHEDVVIKGWNNTFAEFDKEHLEDHRYDWENAYIRCNKCGHDLTKSLSDPSRRMWVHEFPDRIVKGYGVRPFDVPKFNPTAEIIRQLNGYETRQDYENFVHGLPYKSKHSQMDADICRNKSVLDEAGFGNGYYIGIDVGKTCNIVIGNKHGNEYKIVRFMTISINNGPLDEQILELWEQYGIYRGVIDSAPDFSLCRSLATKLGEFIHPCVYVNDTPKKLESFEVRENDNAVLATRTKSFDLLVKANNEGKMEYPMSDETAVAIRHFDGMKRILNTDESGEKVAKWVKIPNTPDHYLHALLYFKLACDIDLGTDEGDRVEVATVNIAGASVGFSYQKDERSGLMLPGSKESIEEMDNAALVRMLAGGR